MFQWYTNAKVCYVYLSDVSWACPPLSDGFLVPNQLRYIHEFEESRWFTRGWTLQELIAPRVVLFYGSSWNPLGSLSQLLERVSSITNIQTDVLDHTRPVADLTIARRFSWAAKRNCTRIEDQAYCLLGMFDISMPLVYGEGSRAFMRLQEMLIGQSTDQSIFAWDAPLGFIKSGELLFAPSPHCFVNSGKIRPRRRTGSESAFRMSNRGLEITLPIVRKRLDQDPSRPYVTLGILDCKYDNSPDFLALVMSQHRFPIQPGAAGIELYVSGFERWNGRGAQFTRLLSVPRHVLESTQLVPLTITRDLRIQPHMQFHENDPSWFPVWFMGDDPGSVPSLRRAFPDNCWSPSTRTMRLRPPQSYVGAMVIDTVGPDIPVLITFGLQRSSLPAITRKIYDIVFIDPKCPIEPHVKALMKDIGPRGGGNTARLRLDKDKIILAQLCGGALTVSIERGGSNHVLSSSASIGSQVSSPTSPIMSYRRPSSSASNRRRDSLLQDGRSDKSDGSQDEEKRKLREHRTRDCGRCQDIDAQRRANQRRLSEDEAKRKQAEKQQKIRSKATQAGGVMALAGLLGDAAEFLV